MKGKVLTSWRAEERRENRARNNAREQLLSRRLCQEVVDMPGGRCWQPGLGPVDNARCADHWPKVVG